MESNGRYSFSSSEGPSSSKKRKTINGPESEREKDKKLMEEQIRTIYEQTMEIRDLKRKLDESVNNFDVDPEMEEREAGLRAEIDESQKRIKDEKADHAKLHAEMKLTLGKQIGKLESVIDEKNTKIKDLEEQLSSLIEIKSDPNDAKKLLQDKIDELQLFNDESAKKIKELEAELQAKAKLENSHQTKLSEIEENHKHQQKLFSDKLEKEVGDRKKTIREFKEKISFLEKSHKSVLDKNMREKDYQIQKLIAKHEQEMKTLKEKFENEAKKAKNEMDGLKSNVQNLTKKISEDQKVATRVQNEISELKEKNTVAEEKEQKLKAETDELKQKLREASATINDHQHEHANDLPRFVTLDEVRDGSKIKYNRLLCKNTVVKVTKLVLISPLRCWLYSTRDPNEKPVKFALDSLKSCFQFQINGELKIECDNLKRFIQKCHSFTLVKLDLGHLQIDYDDFKKMVSSSTSIIKIFKSGDIGKPKTLGSLEIDEIMKEVPNVEICEIGLVKGCSNESCRKLAELPVFPNLKKLIIDPDHLKSAFDIESFVGFLKKHPNIEFRFRMYSLTPTDKNVMRKKEEQFRKLIPSTCKVVFEY